MGWRAGFNLDSCKSKFIEFVGLFSMNKGDISTFIRGGV